METKFQHAGEIEIRRGPAIKKVALVIELSLRFTKTDNVHRASQGF